MLDNSTNYLTYRNESVDNPLVGYDAIWSCYLKTLSLIARER